VRLPNPLGDAVMATPALRALRTALPDTRITWAGGRAAQQALDGLRWRDDVVSLGPPLTDGWRGPWRAGRHLRRLGADAILLLPNSFSSALTARLAGIPLRAGTTLHRRAFLLTHPLEVPRTAQGGLVPRSMRAHYLDLAAAFGARDDGGGTALAVTAHDRERAAARLAEVAPGSALVGVNAGASFGPSKVWPANSVAEAVRRLRERTGALPLVVAAPGEEALARQVAEAVGPPVLATHERPPDVGELKALLQACRLLLTTDAGPRHVAEALGVPTVVWVGPTDPRWGEGGPARVLRVEGLPCLACHLARCPIDHPCMERLEPGTVADAAEAVWQAARASETAAGAAPDRR
jgi:heptosyltransferase-2